MVGKLLCMLITAWHIAYSSDSTPTVVQDCFTGLPLARHDSRFILADRTGLVAIAFLSRSLAALEEGGWLTIGLLYGFLRRLWLMSMYSVP